MATKASNKRALAIGGGIAATILLAVALLLIINPFANGESKAKTADNGNAVTFDGENFTGDGVSQAPKTQNASLVRDSEEKYATPEPENAKPHRVADMPAASTTTAPAEGARASKELKAALKQRKLDSKSASGEKVQLASDGSAIAPADAPTEVQNVIAAANAIKNFPYIWGGGHGSFQDNGYDCSGSISYALAGGNLLSKPMVSGEFMNYGEPGPGKWITIYANGGHMFMTVGGLRYDTSFRDGPRGSRWQTAKRDISGLEVRHPAGL